MEDLFVTYQPSLSLKELGFDEPCFGKYTIGVYHPNFNQDRTYILDLEMGLNETFDHNKNEWLPTEWCSAPLYQQAFTFFSEKYNLYAEIYTTTIGGQVDFTFQIRDLYSEEYIYDNFSANTGGYFGTFTTEPKTEIECLKKLIEIVKEKK